MKKGEPLVPEDGCLTFCGCNQGFGVNVKHFMTVFAMTQDLGLHFCPGKSEQTWAGVIGHQQSAKEAYDYFGGIGYATEG